MSDDDQAPRCGCGHRVLDHDSAGHCQRWRRYPEVLNARQCGCRTIRVGVAR